MRTMRSGPNIARAVIRHAAKILFCALAALGLMRCSEPVGVPTESDAVLLERFAATANPGPELLASVKPLLATERGQAMLGSLRSVPSGLTPLFAHLGEPEYTLTAIPLAQDPAPAGTHPNLAFDDHTTGLVAIGFDFVFFGRSYGRINISTNGFVGFDAAMSEGCCSGEPIPRADFLNNVIALLWSDLTPDASGRITYGLAGDAPNRRFVVHYRNVAFWPSSRSNRIDVQLKLFEGTNVIEIHALRIPPDSHLHTQGIENASGTHAYFVPGRVAANFDLYDDAIRFTPTLTDNTPPVITPFVTGTIGDNGWHISDVGLTWSVTDAESGITGTSGCEPVSITSDQQAITYTCSASSLGGNSSESVSVKRDATDPIVTYSGNAGSYTVDQSVSISCDASDATSGLASTTCADVTGDAYTFGLGTSTFSASATDNAGNAGTASTSFTVSVTPASLCNLVRRWVDQRGVANSLCQQLSNGAYDAFRKHVRAQSGKLLAAEEAEILISLSSAL